MNKKIRIVIYLLIIAIIYLFNTTTNDLTSIFEFDNNFNFKGTLKEENFNLDAKFCQDNETSCSEEFQKVIRRAEKYVYCAIYDLDEENLIHTINNVSDKIDVKIVLEEDYYIELEKPTRKDNNRYLMHNKFCLTEKELITGSFNPTDNGEYHNDNNIIITNSTILINNYKHEFFELWDNVNTKTPFVDELSHKSKNITIKNLFCPDDSCEENVIKELKKAKSSIQFMAFSFTSDSIGDTLVNKTKDGIKVEGIFEKRGYNSKYGEFEKINNSKALVLFDKNKKTMHHKVFIIDNNTVITGSYNPTASGTKRNDENILIIKNKEISMLYLEEYNRIKEIANG